jgi:hypothetical protein
MITDGNIFKGPKMNNQDDDDDDEMVEIQRKINDGEYEVNDSSEEVSVKDKEDLFFATEIETNYVAQPKSQSQLTGKLVEE